jgi:glutathione S-transferase
MPDLILHGFPVSSNTHRVRLLLSLLGISFEERLVNLATGEHLKPAYTAINPRQTVPAVEVDGAVLTESYAILLYLAQRHRDVHGPSGSWWPTDPIDQAKVSSWMFYTANELHNGIGLARNERAFGRAGAGEYAVERGRKSLALLDEHLSSRRFLELDRPTLADVSVYPFVAVAPEAGLAIDAYEGIARWMGELAALPGFVPMPLLRDMAR